VTKSSRIELLKPAQPVHGTIRPPGSKSITNRALVCAALASGTSVLRGALESEDTRVMLDSLQRLQIPVVEEDRGETLRVTGCGGKIPVPGAELFCANSGTTIRFLSALVALGQGRFRLDGVERMRQRPIRDLLDALAQFQIDAKSELNTGCPPVVIQAHGIPGGVARIRGDVSSQFLSGLLLAAPYAQSDVVLQVDGELVSQPYVTMTLAVMRAFGVELAGDDLTRFVIPGKRCYQGLEYDIEPDASAASYFWGAAAIAGGEVTVQGLTPQALQGDVGFVNCLRQMGASVRSTAEGLTVSGRGAKGIDVDMNGISDTAQTLGVVALFAEGPTTIRGVGHIRHKETDRIGDLARELRKFGAVVEEFADGLRIQPPPSFADFRGAEIETYNDHRMAMSFALAALRLPGVVLRNPQCTEKTYPRFFEDFCRLTGCGVKVL